MWVGDVTQFCMCVYAPSLFTALRNGSYLLRVLCCSCISYLMAARRWRLGCAAVPLSHNLAGRLPAH